jgi:cellulose synthase/poly-beta-1,6-N-acetylglucosamine synthase-like glycosyltransferase
MNFLDESFLLCVFASSTAYIGYVLIGYPYLLKVLVSLSGNRQSTINYPELPPVTVVVPCFNEEGNVDRKVKNIFETLYPKDKLEILFVDNGSTDKTVTLLESLLERYPFKLLTSPPGKTQALNKAMEVASAEIIVNTDCDTTWTEDVLTKLIQPLAEKEVGAVCAIPVIKNSLFDSKVRYHKGDWVIRSLESRLDTCCSLDGRLMAFKKSALGMIRKDASTDDFEMTLALRKKGFKSLALSDAFIEEESPETMPQELKQVRRRAHQGILTAAYYRTMLFNPRYGFFGGFIFPSRRVFPLLLPFSVILVVGPALFLWTLTTVIVIGAILLISFLTGNLYKLVQLYGVFLGWVDAVSLKTKADIWVRKTS